MTEHIAIGAVYARAWELFRRRFVVLILLNLLQIAGLIVSLFLRDFIALTYFFSKYPSYYFLFVHPASLIGLPIAGSTLFLLASMSMVLVTGRDRFHGGHGFWRSLLRRFVPALLAVILWFVALALIHYGWRLVIGSVSQTFPSVTMRVGLSLAWLVLQTAISTFFFAALPAATLEQGGPLRAIRRNLSLTAGQRWRIGAIILMLILALVLILAILLTAIRLIGFGLSLYDFKILFVVFLIALSLIMLCLTLVITAAYQQMARLKDGISTEEAAKIFE